MLSIGRRRRHPSTRRPENRNTPGSRRRQHPRPDPTTWLLLLLLLLRNPHPRRRPHHPRRRHPHPHRRPLPPILLLRRRRHPAREPHRRPDNPTRRNPKPHRRPLLRLEPRHGLPGGPTRRRRSNNRRRRVRHRRPGDLWLHHPWRGPADSPDRPGKPRLGLDEGRGRHASPRGPAHTWPGRDGALFGAGVVGGRRALDGHGDDLLAAEEDEAEGAALLAISGGGPVRGVFLVRGEAAEFFAVAEDEVHVAVESHEFAHQLAAVLDRHSHSVVYELQHLRPLRHRHCCCCCGGIL